MLKRGPKEKIQLPNVKNIFLVASGKGGVGKSTIACNIALSLANLNYKVGLLDSDIYGPSVPKIFNINNKPEIQEGLIKPHLSCGIKLMSMGFLVPENSALIWRGPMITKAIHQLFKLTNWGNLDYLIIDTPPGTGDVHLSIAENYIINGAVIVTTPHKLSLIDAFKAANMFDKLKIKIKGIIENMAYFINPSTGEHQNIFGKSNIQGYCNDNNIQFLGSLPISETLSKYILVSDSDNVTKELFKSAITNIINN